MRRLSTAGLPWLASMQSIATGLLAQGLTLVSGSLVARLLGVEGRGELAALWIVPTIVTAVGTLNVPVAVTYYLTQHPEQERRLLGHTYRTMLWQVFVLTLFAGTMLVIWSRDAAPEVRRSVWPFVAVTAVYVCQYYGLSFIQGQRRFKALNICCYLQFFLYAPVIAYFYVLGIRDLFAVSVAWLSVSTIALLITNAVILKHSRPDWTKIDGLTRQLTTFGLKSLLASLSPVETLPIDQALVAVFFSPVTLGLYVVAYAFTNVPRFVAQAIGFVAYPTVAQRGQREHANRLTWLFFWAGTLFNVVSGGAIVLLLPTLTRIFFGKEFAGSVPMARVLLAGMVIVSSRGILVACLRGQGRPGASSLPELAMYPWLVCAMPVALLRGDAVSVATVLAVGYAISLAVAMVLAWRTPNGASATSRTPGLQDAEHCRPDRGGRYGDAPDGSSVL